MKYLIIDDDKKMIKIIKQIICSKEDKFFDCDNEKEAISCYAEHLPDYVLIDIQSQLYNKKMQGMTTLKKIITKFSSAQIIVVTDYDTPASREAVMKAGAIAFFSKENLSELKSFLKSMESKKIN